MKIFRIILFAVFIISCSHSSFGQSRKKKPNITAVAFDESNNIILNNEIAFKYQKERNNFSIFDLVGTELIKGEITSLGDGKFSSIITFVIVDKKFSNPKIIGRNDLIFALCESNVIEKDFSINIEKLEQFITQHNTL